MRTILLLVVLAFGLLGADPARKRMARNAEEESPKTTDASNEVMVDEGPAGDVVVTAEESVDTIKEENMDKCSKCLKSSFRYRHDGFCGKCVLQDVIDVEEQQKLDNAAVKCHKCTKSKFLSRNALLCSDVCNVKPELPLPTNNVPLEKYQVKKTEEKKATKVTLDKTKKMKETEVNNVEVEKSDLKSFNKNKKRMEREKKEKAKEQRKLEKRNKKFGYNPVAPSQPDGHTATLGPLGQIIKAIVIANTWR